MIDISVVVPTHNRRESVLHTLAALARQDYPADRFEAVVAVDGGSDDTRSALSSARFPFPVRAATFETSRGAAAARNLGARAARGRLLLFLDDDIEAAPALLRAHAAAHEQGVQLSVGYLRTTSPHRIDFFQIKLRSWWEAMFATMRSAGHRYDFRDVLTGNCAIDADLFTRIGGFDERFRCHEDYELGVRALAADADVRFVEEAIATHHECTLLARSLRRKRDEGRADVQMLRRHPHLIDSLPLGLFEHYATRVEFGLRRLAFDLPAAGGAVAATFGRAMDVFEAARLRGRWQRRLYDLLQYWYWRGVADAVGRFDDFTRLRDACRSESGWRPHSLRLDLSSGLADCMRLVDEGRPDAVEVVYRTEPIGRIPAFAGAERLKGRHLKASLARELARPLLAALGRAGVVRAEMRGNTIAATGPIPVDALAL
jgi:GT2 family glycosyltransferase